MEFLATGLGKKRCGLYPILRQEFSNYDSW